MAPYPPDVPDTLITGSREEDVVIGCQSREDCVQIQQKLGGDLTWGPTLGLSLVVGETTSPGSWRSGHSHGPAVGERLGRLGHWELKDSAPDINSSA